MSAQPAQNIFYNQANAPKSGCRNQKTKLAYKGNFERVDNNLLTGWISAGDNKPIELPVDLYLDEMLVGTIHELRYRSDLDEAGIADGIAMFEIDCTRMINEKSKNYKASIRSSPSALNGEDIGDAVVLLENNIYIHSRESLIKNSFLELESNISLKNWSIHSLPEIGMRLERYCESQELAVQAKAYTRFSFTQKYSGYETLSLISDSFCLNAPLDKDLELGLLVRGDRYTTANIKLKDNESVLAEENIEIDSFWQVVSCKMEDSRLIDGKNKYYIQVDIRHTGRSHIDISYIWLAEEFSEASVAFCQSIVNLTDSCPVSLKDIDYVPNPYFNSWSKGVLFGELSENDPLPDHWRILCRRNQRENIRLSSVVIESKNFRGDCLGQVSLRIQTSVFDGPVRLETYLDRRFLDLESANVQLTASSGNASSHCDVARIFLLGRNMESEGILHVITKKFRIRDDGLHVFNLNAGDMMSIRKSSADFSAIRICIEFKHKSDLIIHGLSLCHADASQRSARSQLKNLQFEDPFINKQLLFVKGLESWCSEKTLDVSITKKKISQFKSPNAWKLIELQPAKWKKPSHNYPTISIVVPIFNALESVFECLLSVVEKTTIPYDLILVDDASDTETRRFLDRVNLHMPYVTLHRNTNNQGYTKSVNVGMRLAKSDYICILNSDCIVTNQWLEKLIDCSMSSEDIGMVGPLSNAASYQSVPKIYESKGGWSFNPLPCHTSPDDYAEIVYELSESAYPSVPLINGFCQLIKREVIEKIGYLDEFSFPRGFGEENDFCIRAMSHGFKLAIADDTFVYHKKSQSFGHAQREKLSKEGSLALKKKHASVDWEEITDSLKNEAALSILRSKLVNSNFN